MGKQFTYFFKGFSTCLYTFFSCLTVTYIEVVTIPYPPPRPPKPPHLRGAPLLRSRRWCPVEYAKISAPRTLALQRTIAQQEQFRCSCLPHPPSSVPPVRRSRSPALTLKQQTTRNTMKTHQLRNDGCVLIVINVACRSGGGRTLPLKNAKSTAFHSCLWHVMRINMTHIWWYVSAYWLRQKIDWFNIPTVTHCIYTYSHSLDNDIPFVLASCSRPPVQCWPPASSHLSMMRIMIMIQISSKTLVTKIQSEPWTMQASWSLNESKRSFTKYRQTGTKRNNILESTSLNNQIWWFIIGRMSQKHIPACASTDKKGPPSRRHHKKVHKTSHSQQHWILQAQTSTRLQSSGGAGH